MSRTGVVLALTSLVGGLVVVLHGCSHQDCCGGCVGDSPAVLQLSCGTTDLQSVVATGPCASYTGDGFVSVQSRGPGTCHIDLRFATGFTYSTDVTFMSQPGGVCGGPQCKCPDYVAATSGPFMVNNPSDTCVATPDAGADVGASDASADGTGDAATASDAGDAGAE